MESDRPAFAGGDQRYLRDVQYRSGNNLEARVALHRRFSTASVPFPDFAASLIDWGSAPRVLECGTGTGRFWENRHTPRAASLTLTDLSPGMVEEAVAAAGRHGFSGVVGRECDVQALPFEDGSFDIVVANHMLYHVPDPDRAVAELARVLGPDGVLLAATNGYGHMGEMNDAVAEVLGSHKERLYQVFGMDTGEARLRRPFRTVSWHAYDNDLLVTDLDAAVAYALSFPPGDTADDGQQAAVRDALAARFVDGTLRIRTRTGAFCCGAARVGSA